MAKERWVREVQFSPIWEKLVVTNINGEKLVLAENLKKSGKDWLLQMSMVNEWLAAKNLEISSSPASVLR